jgi:hypothetical protein
MEVLETRSSESGVESAIIRSVRRRRLIGSKKRRVKLEIEVGWPALPHWAPLMEMRAESHASVCHLIPSIAPRYEDAFLDPIHGHLVGVVSMRCSQMQRDSSCLALKVQSEEQSMPKALKNCHSRTPRDVSISDTSSFRNVTTCVRSVGALYHVCPYSMMLSIPSFSRF